LRAACIAPQRSLSSSAAQVWAGTAVATVAGYRFINRNRPIALP
jgi:hypothetical protein